jgi:tetratricopeptide (TPR) repeat protein
MTRVAQGRLLLGIALFCSILLYARTLRFDFVYDDWPEIVRNPHLESAAFIPVYFTADVWNQVRSTGQGDIYRPVYLLWLLLNRTLFGISPAGWHASSVFLQLVAVVLLYLVCGELLKDPLGGGIAALLFAVHPANIEAVGWVSCSDNLLMGVPLLLSFFLYLRFRAGGNKAGIAVSALLFALALGSKETAVAFLLILLWHECCGPRFANEAGQGQSAGKIWTTAIVRLAPYFLVVVLYFVVRAAVLGHFLGQAHVVTRGVAALTVPSALLFYLQHLVFPIGISSFHDLAYTETVLSARFALPLLAILFVAGLLWMFTRRFSAQRTAIGWVFLPLLPPLAGITEFAPGDFVHDRYLYLSTMGFAMLVAAFATNLAEHGWEKRVRILLFAVAGTFAWLLTIQLGFWRNNLALFERGVRISPRSVMALDNLANERFRRNDFASAISTYERSLAVDPNSWKTNFALAVTLTAMNENAQAIGFYNRAINIDPQNSTQYLLLAQAQEHENQYSDAEQTIVRGLGVAANVAPMHFELGSLLERRGDFAGARVQYEHTLELDPGQRDAAVRVSRLAQLKPLSETPPPTKPSGRSAPERPAGQNR